MGRDMRRMSQAALADTGGLADICRRTAFSSYSARIDMLCTDAQSYIICQIERTGRPTARTAILPALWICWLVVFSQRLRPRPVRTSNRIDARLDLAARRIRSYQRACLVHG